MNKELESFQAVMDANKLQFNEIEDGLILKRNRGKHKFIQINLITSIGLLIGGLILFILELRRWGILVMIGASSFFAAFANARQREKDSEKKSIKISSEKIEMREGFKVRRVDLEDVIEFRTNVTKMKDVFVGTITLISENNMAYEFLEIFGNDEELIQEDLEVISCYIINNYMPDTE